MTIRPYPAWGLLAAVLAASAWRLSERPAARFAVAGRDAPGWASLARLTPEELERGVAHRYAGLAPELGAARDVGYFTDADWDRLWATQAGPEGHARIERYYWRRRCCPPPCYATAGDTRWSSSTARPRSRPGKCWGARAWPRSATSAGGWSWPGPGPIEVRLLGNPACISQR